MFLFDNMLHNIAKNIKKNPGLVSIPRNHVRQKSRFSALTVL